MALSSRPGSLQPQAVGAALRWSVFVALLLGFVLVPFVLLEGRMNELVQQALQSTASIV